MVVIGCTSTCINIIDFLIAKKMALQGYGLMPWHNHGARAQLLLAHHGVYFAIGALLWLTLFDKRTSFRIITIVFCCIGAIFEIVNASSQYAKFNQHFVVVPISIWLVSLAAILLSVSKNEEIVKKVGLRGVKLSRMLGLMTYPLYLLHQRLGYLMIHEFSGLPMFPLILISLTEIFMIFASFLIVIYLEQPLERLLKRIIPG